MKIMLETTDWGKHDYMPNHVYVLNDSMTRMIAYVPAGSKTVKKFSKPMSFDRANRTFVELEGESEPDPGVVVVEGSKGQKYFLSNHGEGWVCTCTGYRFHGHCKHVAQIQQAGTPQQ